MKASKQLNRSIAKLLGTALCTILFFACAVFLFTSDALLEYGRENSIQGMKQKALTELCFMGCIVSGVGALLLNSKIFNDGND